MEYIITLYQIDIKEPKNKELLDYIEKDLRIYKPKIELYEFNIEFTINITSNFKKTECYKIINKFIKYKEKIEYEFNDDNICIFIRIQ